MGSGFLEAVYQECLGIELRKRGIPAIAQPTLELEYSGQRLTQTFKPDFICYDQIILEIKAVETLADAHRSQVLTYLNVTKFPLGLLINFGHHPGIENERIVLTKPKSNSS